MAYIQKMRPSSAYRVEAIVGPDNLQTAYQLGFLARCGPGMYGVTEETTAVDCTIVERIAVDRKDGNVCKLDHHTPRESCRVVFTSVDQVSETARYLLPGGVMLARSARAVNYENSIEERKKLLAANLEGCGWSEDIHWDIYKPHHLSIDAVLEHVGIAMIS
jgi:hypothetical protein